MRVQHIAIDHLDPHPDNCNVMPADRRATLKRHLQRSANYPPVIVRPAPRPAGRPAPPAASRGGAAADPEKDEPTGRVGADGPADRDAAVERYQILDGHHRVQLLRELGRTEVRCDVWEVDDEQALTLLATLNRLEGRDDPNARAALLRKLRATMGQRSLARLAPEKSGQLQRLLDWRPDPPRPRAPEAIGPTPVHVHFFLSTDERDRLEAALARVGGERARALMTLIDTADR